MRTWNFDDYEEFACAVVDKLDVITNEDEFNDISIIAKYEEARQIIKELMCIGCFLHSIDMHDIEWDGYEDEYIISVTKDDDECEYEVWCEPFIRDGVYITDDSKVTYVLDNCSSKVIPHCEGETVYEVSIGEEFECNNCDCECKCGDDYTVQDKKVDYVFKASPDKARENDKSVSTKELYKINNNYVDRETFEKERAKFEDRYMDNIRDMLLRYHDFMDDWNDLTRLFY